jgi:AraC-like DNA-binding protein
MLSFSLMLESYKERLSLPSDLSGYLVYNASVSPMPRPHRHEELELNLVTGGTATYLIGSSRYDLRLNSMAWIFPEQDHVLVNQSHGFSMWLGIFKRSLIEEVCRSPETRILLDSSPQGHFCRSLSDADAKRLARQFTDCRFDRAGGVTPELFDAALRYVLLASWNAFSEADDLPSGTHIHPAVEHAARLIRDQSGSGDETLSVDRIAEIVGLSPAYLSNIFVQQTGITISQMRNRQRISRFLEIYGKGQSRTMLDAALSSGFGSYAQFHRVFVETMGCNPARYHKDLTG